MAISLVKKVELEKHEAEVINVINLLKLTDVKARVVIVVDGSGSIYHVFDRGTMDNVFLRFYAVARQFDDNQELECYVFSSKFVRLPEVTIDNVENYVKDEILYRFEGGYKDYRNKKIAALEHEIHSIQESLRGTRGFLGFGKKKPENETQLNEKLQQFKQELAHIRSIPVDKSFELFKDNNEVDIMNEIIHQYTVENPSNIPTYVAFFSDGGVERNQEIKNIIRKSSNLPIFWQFIGLGSSNYGALTELDNLDGRVIDNAGFFKLDDIDRKNDKDLYQLALGEFPNWIQAAKNKSII